MCISRITVMFAEIYQRAIIANQMVHIEPIHIAMWKKLISMGSSCDTLESGTLKYCNSTANTAGRFFRGVQIASLNLKLQTVYHLY